MGFYAAKVLRRVLEAVGVLAVVVVLSAVVAGCSRFGPGSDQGAKTSTVVYSVTGSGVTTVEYAAKGTSALTRRTDAELPFKVTVHTVDHSETLYKISATASQGKLGCSITVNGVRVYDASSPAGQPVSCAFVK